MIADEKTILYDRVEKAILDLMEELPDEIRQKAEEISCDLGEFSTIENHPEALGVYMAWTRGPIVIYVEAINAAENGNVDRVCASARQVYLHELGHVLGLNEIELKERNL